MLNKVKGPIDEKPKKRRKVDLKTKIITDKQYLEAITDKNAKKRNWVLSLPRKKIKTQPLNQREEEIIEEDS